MGILQAILISLNIYSVATINEKTMMREGFFNEKTLLLFIMNDNKRC